MHPYIILVCTLLTNTSHQVLAYNGITKEPAVRHLYNYKATTHKHLISFESVQIQ